MNDDVSNSEIYVVNLPNVNNEIKEYAKIRSEILKNNKKCFDKFISNYNNYENLDEVINGSFDLGNLVIREAIEFCIKILIKYDIYEVDEQCFFNSYVTSSKWSDSYDFIHEKYLAIVRSEEEKDQLRTQRRQMRNKVYGPSSSSVLSNIVTLNFGRVLDQANDSAKALAVNTATNVAHGIFNLGAKAFSSVGAYLDKNAIFKDPDTLNTLSNGLTYDLNLIENITSRLIEENGSVQIYIPKPEEIQKSNSIISNSYKVPDKEKRLMLLKSAIELYPFSPEAYIEMIKIDFNFIFLFKNLLDELHLDFIDDFHKLLLDLIPDTVDYNDIKKLVKNLDDYQKLYNDSKSADFSSLIVSSVNKALIDKFNIRFDDSNFVEEDNLFVLYNSLIDSRNDLHVKRLDIPVIIETKSKLEECFISKESDILTTFDNTDSGITKVVDNLDEYLNHRKIQINSDVETKFIHIIVDYVVSKISVSIAQIESNCFEFSKDLLNKFDYYESYLLSNNGLIGKIKSEYSFYDKEFIDRLRVILFDTAKKFINSGIQNLLLKFNKLNSLSQVKIVIASANKLCDKFSIENPAVLSEFIDNAIFNIVSINPSSNYKTYSVSVYATRVIHFSKTKL